MQVIVTNNRTIIFLIAVLLAIPTFGASIVAYFIWSHFESASANYEVIRRSAFADMDEGGSEIVPTWFHSQQKRGEFTSAVKSAAKRMTVSSVFLEYCFSSPETNSDIYGYAGCMEQRGASFRQQIRGTAELLRDEWMSLSLKDRAPFLRTQSYPARPTAALAGQKSDDTTGLYVLWTILGMIGLVAAMFFFGADGPTENASASSYESPGQERDAYAASDIYPEADSYAFEDSMEVEAPTIRYETQEVTVPAQSPPKLSMANADPMSYETLEKATKAFLSVYNDRGIDGSRAYSQKCHKAAKAWPTYDRVDYCVAFDLAASILDKRVSDQFGSSRNQYFKFQSERLHESYEGAFSYEMEKRTRQMQSSVASILDTIEDIPDRTDNDDASDPYLDLPLEGKPHTEEREVPVFE